MARTSTYSVPDSAIKGIFDRWGAFFIEETKKIEDDISHDLHLFTSYKGTMRTELLPTFLHKELPMSTAGIVNHFVCESSQSASTLFDLLKHIHGEHKPTVENSYIPLWATCEINENTVTIKWRTDPPTAYRGEKVRRFDRPHAQLV